MGQHPIDRKLMEHFAFPAPRSPMPHVWYLGGQNRRPQIRPVASVAKFELDCSPEVDHYIASMQNRFAQATVRIAGGSEVEAADWMAMIDCIAIHAVRSPILWTQLASELNRLVEAGSVTQSQASAEFERLIGHRDLSLFKLLVQCAAATFSNLVARLAIPKVDQEFVTGDSVIQISADTQDLIPGTGVLTWFPMGPYVGLMIYGEERWSPIVGLSVDGERPGTVKPTGPPRRLEIRAPTEEPLEIEAGGFNSLIAFSGRKVFARSREAIDAALAKGVEFEEYDTHFTYRPRIVGDLP